MEKVANIAKNTSYFTLALILQKIISFTYFIILARFLGPADLGKYYFAISFTSIFSIFIDIGMTNILTREVARYSDSLKENRKKISDLIGGIFSIKIVMAIVSSLAVVSLINILNYPDITKKLVYIALISMNLDSFTASFYAIVRGLHNLLFESIGSVIFQLIVFSLGLIFIQLNSGLGWIIFALGAASIFNFIYSLTLVNIKWKIKTIPKWNLFLIKTTILLAAPFSVYAISQKAYMFFDTVLLSILASDISVGLYQIPFKIIFALQFLPLAFTASLYPAMSTYWINNRQQLSITFERAMKYLIIISVPISAGIIMLSDIIIKIFKEGFEGAILPMQIIMLALIFVFVNFPIGSLLNATERQKINTINMVVVAISSIFLNFILIPYYQEVGASITVLATNFLMFALGIHWVPRIIDFNYKKIILTFIKVLISAIAMSILIYYLKYKINIFILIILSGLVYFALLFIVKGFKKEDISSIYNSFIKKST